MSLFKTRNVWNAIVGENECFDIGCVCLADLDGSGRSKIVVGSYSGYLRIYDPSISYEESANELVNLSDLICEVVLADPILQVEAGRFISGSEKLSILVLHSQKFATYYYTSLHRSQEGISHCCLTLAYEHKLRRNAFNLCHGPFGGVKGRDCVCVQSMDGMLSIYEQEVFAFSYFLSNILIPGPIRYIPFIDCFVTVSSCRQVECYKLQSVALFSDIASKSDDMGKRINAEWTFSINENAKDISSNISQSPARVFILGERNLYALSEQGQLIFMKKFDFDASSFFVYTAALEPKVTNFILTSHSRTLLVFADTTLQWTAQLNNVPIQILRISFGIHKGLIVTLDDAGHLSCSYLGTNPKAFARRVKTSNSKIDHFGSQQELKQLQSIINDKYYFTGPSALSTNVGNSSSDLVKITLFQELEELGLFIDSDTRENSRLPSIMLKVVIESQMDIKNARVLIRGGNALEIDPMTFVFHNIAAKHPTVTYVRICMKYQRLPNNLLIRVVVTYHPQQGVLNTIKQFTKLPIHLVMKPCEPVKDVVYKITIASNKPTIHLKYLYPNCFTDETTNINIFEDMNGNAGSVVAFKFFGFHYSVSVMASKSNKYRFQSDYFPCLWLVLEDFIDRLQNHSPDITLSFNYQDLPLQEFFQIIDRHFQTKGDQLKLESNLEKLTIQLRAIQKKLLTICKDKAPDSFSNFDIFLEMIYKQIISTADDIDSKNVELLMAASEVSNATNLIIQLLKLSFARKSENFNLMSEALLPNVELGDASHGWEELVNCSIVHFLKIFHKNTEKVTVNTISLETLEDTNELKGHVKLLCEDLCQRMGDFEVRNGKNTEIYKPSQGSNGSVKDKNNHLVDALAGTDLAYFINIGIYLQVKLLFWRAKRCKISLS